jgi:hypothetical protein
VLPARIGLLEFARQRIVGRPQLSDRFDIVASRGFIQFVSDLAHACLQLLDRAFDLCHFSLDLSWRA